MEFDRGGDRSTWSQGGPAERLKKIHIVDTMPDFHYDAGLKSMYMDVVKPTEDHRLHRSSKTGLLLRDNGTIDGPGTLSTGDIDGAQVPPLYKFTNRGSYACQNLAKAWDDLEKSTPKVLIPESVNKPYTNLQTKDITHPEDMEVGLPSRNTNPLEPNYSLPSFVEPFIPLPKFVKDSLNVEDIEGARPASSYKRLERRNHLSVSDIEGTRPGWKPFHRRKFGKEARNLNLDVEDISGSLEERVFRPASSEVYHEVEGSHSKPLTRTRSSETPQDLNLNIQDINGAQAGSGGWEDTTRRRKEFAKNHKLDEREQKELQDSALKFLKTRMQDQIKLKQLTSKDVATTFELLDRQRSGKLDINEVNRAFKTLKLEVCPSDLNAISKAFVHPTGDGYLDYWKLVTHMIPFVPKKYGAACDASNNVGKSVNQGIRSPGVTKSCYDPSWVSDLVAGESSGNKFLPFNSGRPVTKSEYLKDSTSVQQPAGGGGGGSAPGNSGTKPPKGSDWIKKVQFYLPDAAPPQSSRTVTTSGQAQSPPGARSIPVSNASKQTFPSQPNSQTGRDSFQPRKESNDVHLESQSTQIDLSSHLAPDVYREIPVLSVLQEAEPQPMQVIKDVHFQEIVPGNDTKARKRDESLFSTFKPPHEGPPVKSSSEPIFDSFEKDVSKHDVTPLPIGGPFWPGHVETLPENLAPPVLKGSENNGPLPIGGTFWAGIEKPQPSARVSLRRDYPVPPLFSQVHSGVSLRTAGGLRGEKAQSTWVDRLGDAANPLTFVGEGGQVVSRSGMKGNNFSRPGSAYEDSRPHSSAACGSRSQAGNGDWFGSIERVRPQTVNSLVRGSPLEYSLPAHGDRNMNSQSQRPSSSQSCKLSSSSVSRFPSRSRPASAGSLFGMTANQRAECNEAKSRVQKKTISVSEKRHRAQVREDMDTVRLLG
ncbi:hypothetical protein R1sor_008386 [Riccia sorocarpa]|uniref:EF-hand domain-containing protein n=1 Tax=Riccia sorocarpa TaxID=122646 RepID=A0ABD3HWU7_9MARC